MLLPLLLSLLISVVHLPSGAITATESSKTASFSDIYDVLRSHGLPMGLLPKGVTNFSLDSNGRFQVHLDQPCDAKFENVVRYDRNISGIVSYGQMGALSGISAQELFLWFPVKGIRVDIPSSGLIYFDVGVIYKQFSLSLFETPPNCRAVDQPEGAVDPLLEGKRMARAVEKWATLAGSSAVFLEIACQRAISTVAPSGLGPTWLDVKACSRSCMEFSFSGPWMTIDFMGHSVSLRAEPIGCVAVTVEFSDYSLDGAIDHDLGNIVFWMARLLNRSAIAHQFQCPNSKQVAFCHMPDENASDNEDSVDCGCLLLIKTVSESIAWKVLWYIAKMLDFPATRILTDSRRLLPPSVCAEGWMVVLKGESTKSQGRAVCHVNDLLRKNL
ncbi:hypothetical protein ACLOJK_009492 [Asimina triloba]